MILQHINTRYLPVEDRIRVGGETDSGDVVCLWLTRRLLLGILPPLFRWMEQTGNAATPVGQSRTPSDPGPAGVVNRSRQRGQGEADATTTPPTEAPVRTQETEREWLVKAVDMTAGKQGVKLVFRPAPGQGEPPPVTLILETGVLRQWLRILFRLFQQAGWPVEKWPDWIDPASHDASVLPDTTTGSPVLH